EMQIVPVRRSDPEFSRHEIGPKRACNVRQAALVACTPPRVETRSAPCSPGFTTSRSKRLNEFENDRPSAPPLPSSPFRTATRKEASYLRHPSEPAPYALPRIVNFGNLSSPAPTKTPQPVICSASFGV